MTKKFGLALGVAAVLSSAAIVFGGAPQQMPRDRRPADQRAAELNQFEQKIAALERDAAQKPGDASARHLIGTFYFEKTRDASLTAELKRTYLARGLEAEDRALQVNPDYVEALVYKNIILRAQAPSRRSRQVPAGGHRAGLPSGARPSSCTAERRRSRRNAASMKHRDSGLVG